MATQFSRCRMSFAALSDEIGALIARYKWVQLRRCFLCLSAIPHSKLVHGQPLKRILLTKSETKKMYNKSNPIFRCTIPSTGQI